MSERTPEFLFVLDKASALRKDKVAFLKSLSIIPVVDSVINQEFDLS